MKLSIIIPVYNVEQYLNECINNLLVQKNKDIEIILVDDGSTDKSGFICDEYSEKYDFIKVIHKKNGGLSSARNEGIKHATGQFLIFIDSDDMVSKKIVEIALKIIETENPDIIEYNFEKFLDGNYKENNDNPILNKSIKILKGKNSIYDAYYINNLIKRETWTKVYKKKLFYDITFPNGRLAEDLATTYKILSKTDKVIILNQNLYFYRIRNNSIMGNSSIKLFYDAMLAHYEIYNFIKDEKKYSKIAYTNYFNNLMKAYAKNIVEKHNCYMNEIVTKYNKIVFTKLNLLGKMIYVLSKANINLTMKLIYECFIKGGRKIDKS